MYHQHDQQHNQSVRNVKFISIEGNIGAGKSTLLSKLDEYIKSSNFNTTENRIIFLKEPVDVWKNTIDPKSGKNIIELFYENPAKWSFAFQVLVFSTQQKMIEDTLTNNPNCKIIVTERSIEAGRNIFTQMLEDSSYINPVEKQIYELLFKTHHYPLNMCIFLDISPEICFTRIFTRGREGESNINMDYLNSCDSYYRNWLIENNEGSSPQLLHIIQNNELNSVLPILIPFFIEHLL